MDFSKRNMTDLPHEIKECILTKLDGASLIRMRFVSKEWKNILDNPSHTLLKKWENICKSEIDSDNLKCVLNTLEPKYYICRKPDLWAIAYKSWYQWSRMPKWEVRHEKLHNFSSFEISSIINSGEWLLISTRNYGSVVALNYQTKVTELLYLGGNVSDIRPYTVTEDQPLLLGFVHDKLMLEFENLTVATLDLHTLEINFFEELTGRRQFHCFENKEIKIDVNVDRSVITLSRNSGKEEQTIELLDLWSIEHCWTNMNLLSCSKGHYVVADDDLNEINSHPFSYLAHLHSGESTIKHFFGDSVIISVNKKQYCYHQMIVRVLNKECTYSPYNSLSHHITCVVYYGLNLFIGTDMGNIYTYRTEHVLDLLKLDLCSPSTVWEFGSEPIISITIKETSDKPIIWAASHCQIYQTTFL